jgi:hypothetical protein
MTLNRAFCHAEVRDAVLEISLGVVCHAALDVGVGLLRLKVIAMAKSLMARS